MKSYIHRKQKRFKETIVDLESMQHYQQQLHPQALTHDERDSRMKRIHLNYALLYNDMAAYLYEQKEYKDAVLLFQEAKKFRIDDPGILCNIGDCALVDSQ